MSRSASGRIGSAAGPAPSAVDDHRDDLGLEEAHEGMAGEAHRDPEDRKSNVVYPKSPEFLVQFVKGSITLALKIIRDHAEEVKNGERIKIEELHELMKDTEFRLAVMEKMKPMYDFYVKAAKEHRERVKKDSHKRFGDLKAEYIRKLFRFLFKKKSE